MEQPTPLADIGVLIGAAVALSPTSLALAELPAVTHLRFRVVK